MRRQNFNVAKAVGDLRQTQQCPAYQTLNFQYVHPVPVSMPARAPSGQIGLTDEQGRSQTGNFEGQAPVMFRAIDRIAKEAGGSAQSSL